MDNLLLADKPILIYGAGIYARKLYEYCYFHGRAKDIVCFVVSDHKNNPKSIYGIPVVQISEFSGDLNAYNICIAISPKHASEAVALLSENGGEQFYLPDSHFREEVSKDTFHICTKRPLENKVFFDAFDGSGYCCNSKYISQELLRNKMPVDIVWNQAEGANCDYPEQVRSVTNDSPEYYEEIYSSKIVLTNNAIPGHVIKRENQYWINTWHGIGPTKKVALDIISEADDKERAQQIIQDWGRYDLMIAGSDFCESVYNSAFSYHGDIEKWGYPRNDILLSPDRNDFKIRKKYGISDDKRIVLYAPTFRYAFQENEDIGFIKKIYALDAEQIVETLEKYYSSEFVFLYRLHHRMQGILGNKSLFSIGVDVSDYPDMQELLLETDVLITDFSSSMWDFSLMRKPVFLFYTDKDEVQSRTGFYRDPDTYPYPKGHTMKELCLEIQNFDNERYQKALDEWFRGYGTYDDGYASMRVASRITDVIEHPEKYGKDMVRK